MRLEIGNLDDINSLSRNPNITCNELWPNSLEYMNSKIESIIIELSRKLLLDEKKLVKSSEIIII